MLQREQIERIQELYNKKEYLQLTNLCEELIKDNRDDNNLLSTLGFAYLQLNKPQEAKKNYLKAYEIKNDDLNSLYNLSLSFYYLTDYEKTCEYINQLIKINEGYTNALILLVQSLINLNKIQEAIDIFKKSLKYNDLNITILDSLIKKYTDQDKTDEARRIIEELANENPNNIDIKYYLCRFYSKIGAKSKIEVLVNEILEEKEDYYPIFNIISKIKTFKKNDPHIAHMERLLKNNIPDSDKTDLLFNLAKGMDDIADYSQSVKYLNESNLLQRNMIDFNLEHLLTTMENYKNIFSEEFLDKNKNSGFKNPNIIFILGLPRSGSTLVEQIIGNHSEVLPLGEKDDFPNILNEKSKKWGLSSLNDIYNVKKEFFSEIGEAYYDGIKNIIGKNKYITDKALILDRLGFINLALPNAKIIVCKRNSKDHCLSIYQQKFEGFNHPYAYDEKELAIYYNNHTILQDHYLDIFEDKIHIVNYEDIIKTPTKTVKNILEYCDLPWEDKCLKFYKNKRFINTLSSNQVRNPLYKSSINKWKNYKDKLNTLYRILD